MNVKKISISYLLSIILFIIIFVIYQFVIISSDGIRIFENIQFVSIIGMFLYIFIILSWKKVHKRILSPYFIFITTLYLCLCGQSLMWAFGQKAGYRDLQTWGNLFNSSQICTALLFSYLCLLFLHIIVINSIDPITKKTKISKKAEKDEEEINSNKEKAYYTIMVYLGILISLVFIAPYLISTYQTYSTTSALGYGSQYDNVSYGISSIFTKLGEFFPVGVLTLFYAWGKKNEFNKSNFIIKAFLAYSMVILYVACELLVGQRTGVILFSLAFLFIIFKDKKIQKKWLIIGIVIIFVFMIAMRMVDMMRSGNITSFNDFIEYTTDVDNNAAVDFLGDLGWNLMTLIKYQDLVPNVMNYSYGYSYFISTTSIIPNLNFWDIHPAYKYGNISNILREYLGFSFGLGCTPVAEAYYNFGNWGFLVFYLWGKFLIFLNRKFENTKNVLDNYFVVLFVGILLKSCVRSSFFSVFRPLIIYIIIPVLIVKVGCKKIYKKGVI